MTNLKYCYQTASASGEDGSAYDVVNSLGIKYKKSEGQAFYERVLFYDCEWTGELPEFITVTNL